MRREERKVDEGEDVEDENEGKRDKGKVNIKYWKPAS